MDPLWLILLLAAVLVLLAVRGLGNLPPGDAITLIQIRAGTLHMMRGKVSSLAKEHVLDILSEAKVTAGFIAINAQKRVAFSRSIPGTAHQKLRNVLLNE